MVREVAVLLSYRGLNKYRSPLFLFSRVALYVALACLLASFFYSQRQDPRGLLNVASILFLSVTTPTYTASVFVADIGLEREVYTREFHGARARTRVEHAAAADGDAGRRAPARRGQTRTTAPRATSSPRC